MIYYALIKTIYNDKAFVASFDIDVSLNTDDLETLALKCDKYEHEIHPSSLYDFKHPGGTVAIDRAWGRNNTRYDVEERECDEFMSEYAIDKAAINTENDRLTTIILNNRGNMKDSFIEDCKIIKHIWNR
jgi:hypothetical protein